LLVLDRLSLSLEGADGRKAARGNFRATLLERWAKRVVKFMAKDARAVLEQIKFRRAKVAAVPPCHAGPLTLRYALDRGFEVDETNFLFQEYLSRPAQWWIENIPSNLPAGPPQDRTAIDQVPELTVRELIEWCGPGRVMAHFPGWWVVATWGWRLLFILDWRQEDLPAFLVRSHVDPEKPLWQRLAITQVRKRWYFVCPVNGRRYSALYWRDGHFASREAHRLVHVSQLPLPGEKRPAKKRGVSPRPTADG
jgi:hypothetical protein